MNLLLCGDFACHTGLARVCEALADGLEGLGWSISVLAVNYHGDATPLQQRYAIYPAEGGGDPWGAGRIAGMVKHTKADAILMVHDAWNASALIEELPPGSPPVICYVPVDGESLNPVHVEPLNSAAHVIAYTQFGKKELRLAGLDAACSILPHGVDLDLFRPLPQTDARRIVGLRQDVYAVVILDQNQPRKRLDIAFEAFARFAQDKPEHVILVYHGPLKTRNGWDIEAMVDDLGLGERFVATTRRATPTAGVPADRMAALYSMCDVRLSATSGEGWGLPTMEAMACGLPNVAPDFAALGEWARDAALLVEAPVKLRHCGGINTVGRCATPEGLAAALETVYRDAELRAILAARGLALVGQARYRWETIAGQFDAVLRKAVGALPLEIAHAA